MPYELYPVNQVIFTRNELKDFIIGIYRPGKSDIVKVLVNAIPEFDHDGNLSQVIVTCMDITERERVKELLKKSEGKFRFLTENMTDIVWILDMELRATYVSPSIEKVFGYTPEERKRQSIEEQVTPESLKHIMERFQEELLRDKDPGVDPDRHITLEVEYYHKDGSIIWVENIAQAMRDEAGEIVQIYGVSRDITERKHAEAALQQSEMKYRLLAENVTDVICVVSLDRFIFNYVSPSVESVLGYTPKEFMDLNVYDLLTPDSADRVMAILAQEVENNKYGKVDRNYWRLKFYVKMVALFGWRSRHVFYANNKQQANSVLCVIRDVSKRKLVEDALHVAQVGGHDDDAVAEVDGAALAVGEATVVEQLQEDVEDLGVGFFDFVEEHHAVGAAADGFGELTALVVADVTGRGADQPADGVLLHDIRSCRCGSWRARRRRGTRPGRGRARSCRRRWGRGR